MERGELDRNLRLIEREVLAEIDRGFGWTERRVGSLYRGWMSPLMNPLMRLVFHHVGVADARRRARERVRLFVACLEEHARRSTPAAELVDKHFEAFLTCNEVWIRRNPKHPRARELQKSFREEFRLQLEIYSRVVKAHGRSYEELVRNAYPNRGVLERKVEAQYRNIAAQLLLAEEEPDLLRIPGLVRGEIFEVLRAVYDYARARVQERNDEIYRIQVEA